jgi:hypothetical protein
VSDYDRVTHLTGYSMNELNCFEQVFGAGLARVPWLGGFWLFGRWDSWLEPNDCTIG